MRIIEDHFQSFLKVTWERAEPTCIDQSDFDHVANMNSIFVAKRVQLHAHERRELDRIKIVGSRGGFDVWVWIKVIAPDHLAS